MDRHPKKRPRLAWDASLPPQAQSGMLSGAERGASTGFESSLKIQDKAKLWVKEMDPKGSPPRRNDDKDGHYLFALGENLTPRYKILRKIGEGTFGQVVECWDRGTKEMIAIKIVRSIRKYRESAMAEIDVLQLLGKYNRDRDCCVQIQNWFDYRNHICIVFEMLGPSLYDFLRKNNYRSFPIDLVRDIGRQLLECVALMHDLDLIHTDLKPENILFVSSDYVKIPDYWRAASQINGSSYKRLPKSSAIKVIDFGSVAYGHQNHDYIVSTRQYRAPEIILGLGWSFSCDMWSIGCILVELCLGEMLFQTHENLEHLAMMERALGPIPQHMLKGADRHAAKYVRRGRLNWPEGATSRKSIRAVLKLSQLQDLISTHVDHHSAGNLIHLLQGLLIYDPFNRLTAHDALRHPFFTQDQYRRF